MPRLRALRVIMSGEIVLRAADGFGDDHGRVIGRARDDALDGIVDAKGAPRPKAELGGRLRRGMRRDGQSLVQRHAAGLQLLEQHEERHHLGDRGGMAQAVGEAS